MCTKTVSPREVDQRRGQQGWQERPVKGGRSGCIVCITESGHGPLSMLVPPISTWVSVTTWTAHGGKHSSTRGQEPRWLAGCGLAR